MILLMYISDPRYSYLKLQDPMVSKMVLSACALGCSEEMTTIAAVLSVQVNICCFTIKLMSLKPLNLLYLQSIWVSGRGAQKESDEVKLRFAAAEVPIV